ncbi:MAG: IS66 family insertion sequence element accessory protein TnpA [Bacteroidota bacterium]
MNDHIDQWKHIGLNQKSYCEKHGLVMHQFVYWVGKRSKSEKHRAGFITLSMYQQQGDIQVRLPNGMEIALPSNNPVSYLKALIPY